MRHKLCLPIGREQNTTNQVGVPIGAAGGKPLPTSARPCGGRREGGEERRQQAGWCNGTSEKARYEARTQTIAAHEFDKDDTKGTCYVYQALFYATAA